MMPLMAREKLDPRIQDQLPSDEIIRAISKIALEQAFQTLAGFCDKFATEMEDGSIPMVSGPDALRGFAAAIRSNNAKTWPKASRPV